MGSYSLVTGLRGRKMLSLIVGKEPKSYSAEAYRTLRTNLQFTIVGKGVNQIVVTSAEPGDGKSVTTGNLGLSMAQTGKKVLIIDCDLRKPSIHRYFNMDNDIGFVNIVMENLNFKKAIKEHSDNLHVITAGWSPVNPAELLNIEYISPIFDSMKEHYDIILVDTPPIVTVTDAQLLASVSDGVIMVLNSDQSHKKLCKKALQLLSNVNAKILGVVLNKVEDNSAANYDRNYNPYFGRSRRQKKSKIRRGKEVAL